MRGTTRRTARHAARRTGTAGLRVALPALALAALAALVPLGAQPLPGRVVDVAAGEFFFQAPDSIPAGLTTFRLRQVGLVRHRATAGGAARDSTTEDRGDPTRGFHMLWVVRLDSGRTVADFHRAIRAREPGMFRALTVLPTRAAAARAPAPEVVVRVAADGALRLSAPLTAGRRVIRVENAGATAYEFAVARVLPGRTTAEALAWRRRDNPTTPRPFEDWGGLSDVPPGGSLITTMAFEPGDYFVGFADRRIPFTVRPARR
jgi:hypothetical protein